MGQNPTLGADVQGFRAPDDDEYKGSRYPDVRDAVFANPYQDVWGEPYQQCLPRYRVSLLQLLHRQFTRAAQRTLDSRADLRWGKHRLGFRRLLHPNGVCLTGEWRITEANKFSGYFAEGKTGRIIARISSNGSETRRGDIKAYSLVGKIFPTTEKDDKRLLKPANFFTQDDFGGTDALRLTDTAMRNAPNVTAWNRGFELPILLQTNRVFQRVGRFPTIRQLYPISELGLQEGQDTVTPQFMQLRASSGHLIVDEDDFRDEVMAHIYDRGNPKPQRELRFDIQVSEDGEKVGHPVLPSGERHRIDQWQTIGHIAFEEAVISYNGDFVIHFPHPPWRLRVNDPSSAIREGMRRVQS